MSGPNKIHVFSQTAHKRVFVGTLWRDDEKFYFEYDKIYQRSKDGIPLGPEFELWRGRFSRDTFFSSLADHIPSPQNPAYADYCRQWGISEDEKNVFVLLTTIGRRGPSTFVFESVPEQYTPQALKTFRDKLGLNQREFAQFIGISHKTLVQLEAGVSGTPSVIRLIELCDRVPEALQWLLNTRGQYIHDDKREAIRIMLQRATL